jgi:SMC interacting uncharacterized protein involved in chromosome segregation
MDMTDGELQEQIEHLKIGLMSLDDAVTQVKENLESLAGNVAKNLNRFSIRIEEVNDCVQALEKDLNGRIDSVNHRVTELNYDRI